GGEFFAHSGDAAARRPAPGAGDGNGRRIDEQPEDVKRSHRRGGAGERRTEPGAQPGGAKVVSRSGGGNAGGRRSNGRAAGDARLGGGVLRRRRADGSERSHGADCRRNPDLSVYADFYLGSERALGVETGLAPSPSQKETRQAASLQQGWIRAVNWNGNGG